MESSKPASERLAPSADAMAVDPSYAGPVLPPAPPAGTAPVPASALMADENLTNEHGISLGAWAAAACGVGGAMYLQRVLGQALQRHSHAIHSTTALPSYAQPS